MTEPGIIKENRKQKT